MFDSLRVFQPSTIFFCQETPVLQNLRVSKAANDEGRNAVLLAQTTEGPKIGNGCCGNAVVGGRNVRVEKKGLKHMS